MGRFDLSPPLRPEKGVGGTRALAHLFPYVHKMFALKAPFLSWMDPEGNSLDPRCHDVEFDLAGTVTASLSCKPHMALDYDNHLTIFYHILPISCPFMSYIIAVPFSCFFKLVPMLPSGPRSSPMSC